MIFYFGTFNPIHKGHLKIVDFVEQTYKESVILVPAYDSPWKPNLKETFEHRCNMINLCNVSCCDIEKELPTPSYTWQTVNKLYEKFKPVKLVIGFDQFFSLPKWKRPATLKKKCEFIVIPREIKQDLIIEYGWHFNILDMPTINISSSEIRQLLHDKKPCDMITSEVYAYIKEHNLY